MFKVEPIRNTAQTVILNQACPPKPRRSRKPLRPCSGQAWRRLDLEIIKLSIFQFVGYNFYSPTGKSNPSAGTSLPPPIISSPEIDLPAASLPKLSERFP